MAVENTAPATKMTQEEIFAKQEQMNLDNANNSFRMQQLQNEAHKQQEEAMTMSNLEKAKDDVIKNIASNLK